METLQHLAISRHLQLGINQLFVVDRLFSTSDVASLFKFLVKLPYHLNDFDTEETSYARHWKSELPISFSAATPIGRDCVDSARRLFPDERLSLQRVHSNLHLHGDMQFPHRDIAGGVTALYYANPEWNESWLGETVFYDGGREPLYTVGPAPGRLVVFDGDILHRAGVPSRECYTPRISVAFKFAREARLDPQ